MRRSGNRFPRQHRTVFVCKIGARRTRLDLCLLGLADNELVELLLVFGTEVLQALLGLGGDLKLVHCDCEVLVVVGFRLWRL
jgi:hypothetical protein